MKDKTQVIAIDGAAATGKSTLAKKLAADLGYIYMDTGLMFRVLTFEAIERDILSNHSIDQTALLRFLAKSKFSWQSDQLAFNNKVYGDEIRTMVVSQEVSRLAALEIVRNFTLDNQRRLAKGKKIVMDGRDIGTVVFPNAAYKFFLQASPQIRARRRWEELQQKGEKITLENVLQNVLTRDQIDSERENAPLKQATDAQLIDTSDKSIDTLLAQLKAVIG